MHNNNKKTQMENKQQKKTNKQNKTIICTQKNKKNRAEQ